MNKDKFRYRKRIYAEGDDDAARNGEDEDGSKNANIAETALMSLAVKTACADIISVFDHHQVDEDGPTKMN